MRRMMQAHLDLRADAEVRVPVKGADGVVRGQARLASRSLRLLVGDVRASRIAHQAAGVAGLHPMDAALQLPDEVYSYGVRRAVAVEVARSAYEDVQDLLGRHLRLSLGKRQLEELAVRAAEDFDAFYAQRTAEAEPTDDLLILSFDGGGIIMRNEDPRLATQKAAEQATHTLETRLSPGEKRNRKRMAEVTAIYTIAPFQRTVIDVVHSLRPQRDAAAPRPQPTNKRVWASVTLDARDVIRETFQEALRRDPEQRRRWVVLVDGNPDQIRSVRRVCKDLGVRVTMILDLIHVLEYLPDPLVTPSHRHPALMADLLANGKREEQDGAIWITYEPPTGYPSVRAGRTASRPSRVPEQSGQGEQFGCVGRLFGRETKNGHQDTSGSVWVTCSAKTVRIFGYLRRNRSMDLVRRPVGGRVRSGAGSM